VSEACQGFTISCPFPKEPIEGALDIGKAVGSPRGVVLLFSGGRGTSEWGDRQGPSAQFIDDLQGSGLTTVRVRWLSPWLFAAAGEQVGPAKLACRPATVARWVYDNVYAAMGLSRSPGSCGFCVAGDSGGASQAAYLLSHYGMASIIDVAVLASGPPHAALAMGCLHRSEDRDLWYTAYSTPIIDSSYGFLQGDGPCARHDASFADQWNKDSVDTGGSDYAYPSTRVVFLFGEQDRSEGPSHGEFFLARLREEGAPDLSAENVPGMGHLVANYLSGLDALKQALLEGG
jgi:hypothetical protein